MQRNPILIVLRTALVATLVAGWLGSIGGTALAIDASEMFADPAKEARARDLGRNLRCLVCQNQSIFDSNAGLAKDLRAVVRERIDAGDSDTQVLDYVAARYGDYVLLGPPVNANTYILWAAPLVLLAAALGLGAAYMRGRSRTVRPVQLTDAERQAAQRILRGDRT